MKKRARLRKPRTELDVHHILFTRRAWSYGAAKVLRDYWYCQVAIPREGLHRWIHEEVCRIPVPTLSLCAECVRQLRMLEKAGVIHKTDPIEKRLRILICCLDTGASQTADALKRQLDAVNSYKPG